MIGLTHISPIVETTSGVRNRKTLEFAASCLDLAQEGGEAHAVVAGLAAPLLLRDFLGKS